MKKLTEYIRDRFTKTVKVYPEIHFISKTEFAPINIQKNDKLEVVWEAKLGEINYKGIQINASIKKDLNIDYTDGKITITLSKSYDQLTSINEYDNPDVPDILEEASDDKDNHL